MPIDVSTAALTGNISLPLPPLAIKVRCTAALLHRGFSAMDVRIRNHVFCSRRYMLALQYS